MNRTTITLVVMLILIPSALALSTPVTYNGKTYYAVSGTDPTENTGAKVCAKAGMTCVGYTDFDTNVCQQFHPGATVTSGMDGSKAGFYCNGAPQQGVCGTQSNTCNVCPACNVNADCNFDVSGLFREMYIECAGTPTAQGTTASGPKTYADFLADLQNYNTFNSKIPSFFKGLIGTHTINILVSVNPANPIWGSDRFWAQTQGGNIVADGRGWASSPDMIVSTSKTTIEWIMNAPDSASAAQQALRDGRIIVQYRNIFGGFWSRLIIGAVNLGITPFTRQLYLPPPTTPQYSIAVGPYPGYVACEFYQATPPGYPVTATKKLVSCGAYKAADTFCVLSMQSIYARAVKCEDNGQIVCTNPCSPPTYQLPITRCASDINRPRGNNAPPLTWCSGAYTGNTGAGVGATPSQPVKKAPGQLCNNGGECTTGSCVGDGQGPPWVYRCSCAQFSVTTSGPPFC